MARDVTIEPISIDGKDPEISELRFSPLTPDKKKVEIVNSHKDTKDFKKLWQIARIFTKAKIGSDLSNACIEVLQAKGEFAEQAHNVLIDDYSKSYSGKQSDILKQEVIIKLLAGATSYAAQNFLFQTIALYDDGMTDIGRKHADLAGESLASTEVLLPYVQNGLLGLLDCGKPILLISQRPYNGSVPRREDISFDASPARYVWAKGAAIALSRSLDPEVLIKWARVIVDTQSVISVDNSINESMSANIFLNNFREQILDLPSFANSAIANAYEQGKLPTEVERILLDAIEKSELYFEGWFTRRCCLWVLGHSKDENLKKKALASLPGRPEDKNIDDALDHLYHKLEKPPWV